MPSGARLIRARLLWDRGKLEDSELVISVMIDSGAVLSVISEALASTLQDQGCTAGSCNLSISLAAGDAPVVCSRFLAFTATAITTAYGSRALPAFSMVIVPGLNIPAILGLDVLAAGGIVIDPALADIWHLDDIRLRTRDIHAPRTISSVTIDNAETETVGCDDDEPITLPDLLRMPPLEDPPDAQHIDLGDDARDAHMDPRVQRLVEKHARIFGKLDELPPRRGAYDAEMLIIRPDEPPTRHRNRLTKPEDVADAKEFTDDWLMKRLAFKGNSPWAVPLGLAKRPRKNKSRRKIFDCRSTNARLENFPYPLPLVTELINRAHGATTNSLLDCTSAYNQLRIKDGHEYFNAFVTPEGRFHSRVAMMGSKNSGLYWQRFIDAVLQGDPAALPRWPDDHPRHAEGERNHKHFHAHPEDLPDLSDFAYAYSDDIRCFSRPGEDHIRHLGLLLERLDLYALRINEFHKFGASWIEFLGYRVGPDSVQMLPDRVAAIAEYPAPTTIKELQRFLGILQHYRAHVPNLAEHSAWLTPLTRKVAGHTPRTRFALSDDELRHFQALKDLVALNLARTVPDPNKTFIIVTDASIHALAACLLQPTDAGDDLTVIAYYSRQTSLAESKAGQFKLEMYGIASALTHWRATIAGRPTIVYTDCEPIVRGDMLSMSRDIVDDPSGKLLRRILAIQDMPVDLRHHSASTSLAEHVDTLSRRPDYVLARSKQTLREYIKTIRAAHAARPHLSTAVDCCTVYFTPTTPTMLPLDENSAITSDTPADDTFHPICVIGSPPPLGTVSLDASFTPSQQPSDGIPYDEVLNRIRAGMQAMDADARRKEGLEFVNGFWRKNGRIAVPEDDAVRTQLIRLAHEPGHRGTTATGRILGQKYYWRNMFIDVRNFIGKCVTCAVYKQKPSRCFAGSTPRTPPSRAFDTISMDFIPDLPDSGGFSRILTVIDEYSTYGIFIAVPNTLTAKDFRDIFMERIYPRIGFPRVLRSDNDSLIRADLWHNFADQGRATSHPGPPFRHEANGHAERGNQTIESILRCVMDPRQPDVWHTHLPLAERIYNQTPHDITGLSRDTMAFNRNFRNGFGFDDTLDAPVGDLDAAFNDIQARISDFLVRAEASRANRDTRGLPQFRVGDWVLLSTQHLRFPPGAMSRDPRLRPRYIGPFRVTARISIRTYKLDLPRTRVLNAFDIDRLRTWPGSAPTGGALIDLIQDADDDEATLHFEIERILALRGTRDPDGRVTKHWALIRWANYDESYDDWVALSSLVEDAPGILLEYVESHSPTPRFSPDVSSALERYRSQRTE